MKNFIEWLLYTRIHTEKPGVISEGPVWVGFGDTHMYISETLVGLLWLMAWEYKHDRHLVV